MRKLDLGNNRYFFLLPALAVMLLVLIVPVFSGLRLSFFSWSFSAFNKKPEFVGWRNFHDLFISENFHTSMRVTVVFTLSVMVLELSLGLLLALLLEEGIPAQRFFRTLFVLPAMLAPVIVGVVWRFLYNPSYGKINYFLSLFGIHSVEWLSSPRLAMVSIIITDVWQWTPFVFLLLLAALQGIPKDMIEAGRVDGASYFQLLFHVKIPAIFDILTVTAVLRMIDALRSLVVIMLLTDGGPGVSTQPLSLYLYKVAFTDQRLGKASASAVILLMIIMLLSVFFVRNTLKGKKV